MNVGILYLTPDRASIMRQYQLLSDTEPASTALEIKRALEISGHCVDLVLLNQTTFSSLRNYDWIFNLTENVYGYGLNEAQIAEKLEALNIPFTGAGSKGLRLCGDKLQAKAILQDLGIPTPRYEIFELGKTAQSYLGFPVIVKPAFEDASVGIHSDSVVFNKADLVSKVKEIHQQFSEPALVEEYIDGRDIELCILGNGDDQRILPPYECGYLETFIGPHILSFEAKWDPNAAEYQNSVSICPAPLAEPILNRARKICGSIFTAFCCRDYARVDFRLRENELFALEVNPNPCIHESDTSFTLAARAAGLNYADMVAEILNQSVRYRHL